jgi:hypothetical protein
MRHLMFRGPGDLGWEDAQSATSSLCSAARLVAST